MAFDDTQFNLPKYSTDKVIGILKGTFVIDTNATNLQTFEIPTGIDDSTLVEGVFLVQGGIQYQNLDTSYLLGTDLASVVMKSGKGKVVLVTTAASSFIGKLVFYRIALIAKMNQGVVELKDIDYDTLLTSKRNYRKIFKEDIVPLSFPDTSVTGIATPITVAHNLGYYPTIKEYIEYQGEIMNPVAVSFFVGVYSTRVIIGTKDITIVVGANDIARDLKLHYRIYFDKH
jgi:hypothetical protein